MNWNQRYAHDAAHLDWLNSRGHYTPWHEHIHLEPQEGIKILPAIDDMDELKRHLINSHFFTGDFTPPEIPTHPRVREQGGPEKTTLPLDKWLEYLHATQHFYEVEEGKPEVINGEPETHRHYPTTIIQTMDY